MARPKRGGRVTTSSALPALFAQQKQNSTETKYYGLVRDNALSDIGAPDKALQEVLTDIQDPAEFSVLGKFTPNDLQVLDAAILYDLKREDFEVLNNASINAEDEQGRLVPLINPRQRIADRIKQFEGFAGRGTVHQGQGTVQFKYQIPIIKNEQGEEIPSEYHHNNPPPFFTESITSEVLNAPDHIPTSEQVDENQTHRVGFLRDGVFTPLQEAEWWWSGEYEHEFRDRSEYGDELRTALTDPKYPIVRDGNLKFSDTLPKGITNQYNWGLRFDAWFKRGFSENFMRWVAQVNGHVRIDYFERTGYNSQGVIQGTWKTALNTADSGKYYVQAEKERPTTTLAKSRVYYIQGGPHTPLGGGTGTLPPQVSPGDGGALDLNATFPGREEGEVRSKFNDDYVPVVIRFWYGRPDPNPNISPLLASPGGPATLVLDMLSSSISESDLPLWNDYSAQIRVSWNESSQAWQADTGAEENFTNFAERFEIVGYGPLVGANPIAPSSVANYIFPDGGGPIIATKQSPISGTTRVTFSLPGVSVPDGQKIWVIAKNRPWNILPSGNRNQEELWQRYLFNPNLLGGYEKVSDMLDGIGNNYVEPDPIFKSFDENENFYKAKYVRLPSLNTYGPARYDGMVRNSITTSNTSRDYDYLHSKLLLVGRQKKSAAIKPLAPDEVRKNGELYTFIEVVENEAGRGGNVVINAYPTNNLSVLSTSVDNAQVGKFLHMGDNIKTFNNPSRQNITAINPIELPDSGFPGTNRLRYQEMVADGSSRLQAGTWNGTAFTPDTTGIISSLSMGRTDQRDHDTKSAFLSDFEVTGGQKYSFYGLIGVTRPSAQGQTITVDGSSRIESESLFPNGEPTTEPNQQYIGTEINFPGDGNNPYRVTQYDASAKRATISPAKAAGTYQNCEIWYNHLVLGGTLPNRVVNSSSADTQRSSVLSNNGYLKAFLVFNGAYQYSRVDNGSGLSFSEILFSSPSGPTPAPFAPFASGAELPAPPADIVTPFGYDNSPSNSSNPGLGGLCYPPYSIQNLDLQGIKADDTTLYGSAAGNYDMWWGSRSDLTNLGNRSLTITNKLLFDISEAQRSALLQPITSPSLKPTFSGNEYTHKLEVELNVQLPDLSSTTNPYLLEDAKYYSNNKPVKDRYYLFINNNQSQLEVIAAPTSPNW